MLSRSFLFFQFQVVGIAMAVLATFKSLEDRFRMRNSMAVLALGNSAVLTRMTEHTPQLRVRPGAFSKKLHRPFVTAGADLIGRI